MINIHLNGDIIRCPNTAEIQRRAQEIRDKHHVCKYNYHELDCETWLAWCKSQKEIKRITDFGRCHLCANDNCPGHQLRQELGRQEKKFRIDNVNYRKLSSAAHYLVKKSKYKTLFITLTFPKFKDYDSNGRKNRINGNTLNKCFSNFVKKMRESNKCTGYVAVFERGKRNSRPHYHLLISLPFIPFNTLNDSWLSCISDICEKSKNALTSNKKTLFIKNPRRALKYVCKYFAKTKGATSKHRIIFISNNLIKGPRHFDNENCEYYRFDEMLKDFKSVSVRQISEFCTAFRINDRNEFDIFCERIIYKLFNLPENSIELYSYHPLKN